MHPYFHNQWTYYTKNYAASKQRYWQNRETANVGLDSSEPRHVNPEVAGSSPALVNLSLFNQIYLKMYPVSFPCGLLHETYYNI